MAATLFALLMGWTIPAWACSPAGPLLMGLAPVDGSAVSGNTSVVVSTVGMGEFSLELTDATGATIALQAAEAPDSGGFSSFRVLRPEQPLPIGTYTLTPQWPGGNAELGQTPVTFEITDAVAPTSLTAPTDVQWFAQRFDQLQDNTCFTYLERHQLTLQPPAEAVDRLVWYEVDFTSETGVVTRETIVPRSFAVFVGDEPAAPDAEVTDGATTMEHIACVSVTAVDQYGNRSAAVEQCAPAKCTNGGGDLYGSDWDELTGCGEAPGSAGQASSGGCSVGSAGAPTAGWVLVLVLACLLTVRGRRRLVLGFGA